MSGTAYQKTITLSLSVAADDDGICQSQSKVGAGNLTINGALASGGVANLTNARRVLFTFAGDESGHNFTVTGTDRYGRVQSEVVAGTTAGTTYTNHDFLTVTQVAVSASTTSTLKVGTNGVGSSDAYIVDAITNPANYSCAVIVSGTVNCTVQESYDDFAPDWDLASNTPTWFNDANFTSKAANTNGVLNGPFTMIRLTINSGTGTATARILTPFVAGPH